MSGVQEPLLGNHWGGKTMHSLQLSQLDEEFSNIQSKLEGFFVSKTIDIGRTIELTFFSQFHRKIFIYSESTISVFDLESHHLESTHPISCSDVVSMTGNEDSIFLGTGEAELIQIAYPSFEETHRVSIGAKNLFVTCRSTEGVWAVSYGYTMYYYNLEEKVVYRLAAFPWASGAIVSPNEQYLVGFKYSLIRVYSRQHRFIEKEISTLDSITSVQFSEDSNLLVIAHGGGVTVVKVEDWTVVKAIQAPNTSFARFYGMNNYVVYSNSGKISVWNPYNETTEQEFVYGTQIEDVSAMEIDEKNNCAYLSNRTNFFYRHTLPSSNYVSIPGLDAKSSTVFSDKGTGFSISYNEASIIDVENLSYRTIEHEYQFDSESKYCYSESQKCVYANFNAELNKLSNENLEVLVSIDFPSSINELKEINNKLYVLEEERLSVVDFEVERVISTVILPGASLGQITEINSTLIVSHGNAISCIHEGIVSYTQTNAHSSRIIGLFESSKGELISISSDCAKLWLVSPFKEIRVHKFSFNVECVCISQTRNWIYVGSENKIIGYLLPDFVEFFKIGVSEEVSKISLLANEQYIVVCAGSSVYRIINPAGGDFNVSSSYIDAEKIIKTVKGQVSEYDPKQDKWIIFPYGLNALHCYTFYNQSQILNQSLANKGAYITSTLGDPISIALNKNYRECANTILTNLRFRVAEDFYALSCIEDKLAQLNKGSYKGLDELYDACFVLNSNTGHPNFCSETTVLPKTRISPIIGIAPFLEGTDLTEKSVRVEYYTTTLGISFT